MYTEWRGVLVACMKGGAEPGQTRDSEPGGEEWGAHCTSFLLLLLTPEIFTSSHERGKWRAGVRDRVMRRFNLLLPLERVWQLAADILFKLTPALKYRSQGSVYSRLVTFYISAHFQAPPPGVKVRCSAQGRLRLSALSSWRHNLACYHLLPPGSWPSHRV